MLDKSKVERFIAAALKYRGNSYSQPKRMDPGYSDCSSLIYKGLRDAGLLDLSQTKRTISTKYMRDGDPRFERINMNELQRGDVLWWQKPGTTDINYSGHVAIYLGDGKALEAIYAGVGIKSSSRIAYQRAYRIKSLKANIKPKAPKVVPKDLEGIVTAKRLNIRDNDGTYGTVIGSLTKGDKVKITGRTSTNWYEILYKGSKAYISNQYVQVKSKPDVIRNVPILINGKEVKKGYIVKGVTYINVNGKDIAVRKLFEGIGAKVSWIENQVEIKL